MPQARGGSLRIAGAAHEVAGEHTSTKPFSNERKRPMG
jgi:hypothetical protein